MSLIHKNNLACGVALCVAAALCASCGSDSDPVMAGTDEMVFTIGNVSRTSVTDQSNITQSPFAVYGDMILKENSKSHPLSIILNGTTVTYSDGAWNYPSTQYWMPKHEHSFVAVHPAGATALSDLQYQNSQLTFTYNQPSNYQEASDLLTATHRRYYDGGKTNDVRFRFSHILSRFGVEVTYTDPSISQDAKLIIKSITFKDIPAEATYNIAPAPLLGSNNQHDDYTDGWDITKKGDLEIIFSDDEAIAIPNDNKEHKIFSDNEPVLLLPNQDLEIQSQIILSYMISDEDRVENASLPLPKWEQAKSYTLSLKLIKGKINFSFTVADWATGDNTDTTVPRR